MLLPRQILDVLKSKNGVLWYALIHCLRAKPCVKKHVSGSGDGGIIPGKFEN